jgi:hypothetical protein
MKSAGVNFENTVANTIFLLEESGRTFDGIVKMSEEVMPIEDINLHIAYGNESILRLMMDMLMRAKEELQLITPKINNDFLYQIEKQPQMTNYQIISNISNEDVVLLSQLVKRGNTNIMKYEGEDYWAAIRDNEEILIAPIMDKENNIAIITENEKLYELFYEILKNHIFDQMKSKKIDQSIDEEKEIS